MRIRPTAVIADPDCLLYPPLSYLCTPASHCIAGILDKVIDLFESELRVVVLLIGRRERHPWLGEIDT
jgi:hypothetical protein